MTGTPPTLVTSLEAEHRELDQLLGRFLAAASAGNADGARKAIAEFDGLLRSHTQREEEDLYGRPAGYKLVPDENEDSAETTWRELRLEHVQIREVSGMMRRLLEEKNDLVSARALTGNLARRWEAHTDREERQVFPLYAQNVDQHRG